MGDGAAGLAGQDGAETLRLVQPGVDLGGAGRGLVRVEVAGVGEGAPELGDLGGVAVVVHQGPQAEELGAHGGVEQIR